MDDTAKPNQRVASEIRAWIGRRQTTGRKIAAKIGKSQSWVSTRTRGETPITIDDLHLFADALDVRLGDLIPRDGARAADKAYSAPATDRPTRAVGRPRYLPVRCATHHAPNSHVAVRQESHSGHGDRRPVIQPWTRDGVAA